MITFTILICALLLVAIVAAVFGVALFTIFGDAIACGILIYLIIKLIKKAKKH